MYDMYPDGWTATEAESHADSGPAQPRRRARKEHSVEPAVLVRHAQQTQDADAESDQVS